MVRQWTWIYPDDLSGNNFHLSGRYLLPENLYNQYQALIPLQQ